MAIKNLGTDKHLTIDDVIRCEEIAEEIKALLAEAFKIIRRSNNPNLIARVESYWMAQMKIAMSNDHDYLAKAGYTFTDTIAALHNELSGEDDAEE